MMWAAAIGVALLLSAAASLTARYEAVAQISKTHLRTLEEEGFEGAEALADLREKRSATRLAVRVTTATLNLTALAVIALTGVSTWGVGGPLASLTIGVGIVLLVTEIVPQLIVSRRPVRLALSSAPFLQRLSRVVQPLSRRLDRRDDRDGSADEVSAEVRELREIQEIGEAEGVLEESENDLVRRAFRLDEMTAWDAMIPRVDIFAWKEELPLEEIVGELSEVPYSRVPVYRESVDDVTGIVYVREMYERFARGDRTTPLSALAHEPVFVPGSLSLSKLLQLFRARRVHMGIVADEFGGTDGLVTLEDVLEELVGEIHDETDVEEEEIVRVSDVVLECDAGVDVRDVEEALSISLPKVEHRSLNGLILEELGHVPKEGERFEISSVDFVILEATETQVLRARLTRATEPPQEG